jgi:hypothetical protein
MLATKKVARKAVAGGPSISLNRPKPRLPDDVGYRRSGHPRTISGSLNGVTIGTLLALDYCVATTDGGAKNTFAVRWRSYSAETEQVAASMSQANCHLDSLLPQCSFIVECDKSQQNKREMNSR